MSETRPGFELRFLGHPVVRRQSPDGEPREVVWRLRRALLAVAFLSLRPDHRATKDEIVTALWREAGPRAIRQNFHPTLSDARRSLGTAGGLDPIVFRQGVYVLHPEIAWWVDHQALRRRIAAGREALASSADDGAARALETWRAAWGLYRGPLLQTFDADWIQSPRRGFHRDYLDLLRRLGDLAVRLERHTLALDAYRSVLLEEPFEERVHLAVMELYARQGRRDLVRRQFVRLQGLLLDELDVEPMVEVQERYHQLMR